MTNEIEKTNPDDVLAAIQSFNDPYIVTNIFKQLGWTYTLEISETIVCAKQNANLSIKLKAIQHLRKLLREAAETSGYIADVSHTALNALGGQTTFHSKRIAGMLSPPAKQIKSTDIKEPENDQAQETKTDEPESNRRCDRREDIPSSEADNVSDTRDTFPPDKPTGTNQPSDTGGPGGGEPPTGGTPPDKPRGNDDSPSGGDKNSDGSGEETNPCIKTRPPTCDKELFPGISTSAEES